MPSFSPDQGRSNFIFGHYTSRWQVFQPSYASFACPLTLAALVNCIGLLLITGGDSLVGAAPYQSDSGFFKFLFLCMLALFILQLMFLAIGIFLGCAMKQYKRASSLAVSLLLGTYFLSIAAGLNKNLDFLKYFSSFKYFDAVAMLHESRIDLAFVGLSLAIVLVAMVGAYLTYARRDLYTWLQVGRMAQDIIEHLADDGAHKLAVCDLPGIQIDAGQL